MDESADSVAFDESFWGAIVDGAYEHHLRGASQEQAFELAQLSVAPAVEAVSEVVMKELTFTRPQMLREHQQLDRAFRRRLRRHWGPALDQLYAMAVCAEEMGGEYDSNHTGAAVEQNDLVFEALTRLQARACRIAFEVHTLLSAGFPMGALARCRTMHEIAVTATVIRAYGSDRQYADIGERYLLHDLVIATRTLSSSNRTP